jgi:molybdopterin-containing oxidoreductase family molybdopterin binding subunit
LRLLWIAGSHALGSGIGYTAQIEAWKKIDFVVVASEYMTDTAKQASLALPVTMPFEQVDFTYGFMNQKAIEPIGESKSDFEIFVALAGAMGYDDLYDKDAEGYLRELLDTEVNKAAGLGYDDYQEKGMIYVDEIKRVETVGVEYNATGRTQFFVESLVTNGNWEVQTTLQDRLPSYEHAYEAYADNPLRSDYPLFGISYHDNYTGQCMHHNVAWLNEIRGYKGEPYTFIHEKAAAERGIVTGDNIRIFNDRGSFVTRAVVTKGIQEETINIPRGYEASEMQSGHLQSVTSIDARDRITNNDSHNDWLCQVEKV